MSKPLRGKIFQYLGQKNNIGLFKEDKKGCYFLKSDVKSAVEGFFKEINNLREEYGNYIDSRDVLKKIEEWFEDVIE